MRVVCGILIWDDRVLVGRRKLNNKTLPGKWEFPGGKVEDGETEWQAIKREFKEELDIEVYPFHRLRTLKLNDIEFTPFTLKFESGKAKLNEHEEVRFVDKTEFAKLDLTHLSDEAGHILFDSYSIFLKTQNERSRY